MGACEAYRDRISAYLDGELTGEERRELLAHLEICGDCRMYLDSELAIREALAGLETPAPEGFEARVMEKIRAESGDAPEEKVAAFPGWRRWAALAACCAVVCLGIFGGGILKGWSALDAAADGRAGSGAAVEAPELSDGLYRLYGGDGTFLSLSQWAAGTLCARKNFFGGGEPL